MPEPDADGRPAVQPADPSARRRAGVALIVIVAVGALAHFALQEWLAELKQGDVMQARASLVTALIAGAWVSGIMMAALAAWLWRQGSRVRSEARYPLADAKLVRDTAIIEGAAAQSRGKLLQAIAVGLALLAIVEVAAIYLLAARFQSLS